LCGSDRTLGIQHADVRPVRRYVPPYSGVRQRERLEIATEDDDVLWTSAHQHAEPADRGGSLSTRSSARRTSAPEGAAREVRIQIGDLTGLAPSVISLRISLRDLRDALRQLITSPRVLR